MANLKLVEFMLAAFLPLTIFYFINITSSNLYGIALYTVSQCAACNGSCSTYNHNEPTFNSNCVVYGITMESRFLAFLKSGYLSGH